MKLFLEAVLIFMKAPLLDKVVTLLFILFVGAVLLVLKRSGH